MNQSADLERIEKLVISRETHRAELEIAEYYKNFKSERTLFHALEWLRRLGLQRKALSLLFKSCNSQMPKPYEREKLFWAMRLLHYMDAHDFARELSYSLSAKTAQEAQFLGEVALASYDYPKAIENLTRAMEEHEKGKYAWRISAFGLADAWAGLKKWKEAEKILGKIEASDSQSKGILLQMRGEFLARQEDFNKALHFFDQADAYIPKRDLSVDRVLLNKWRAYCLGKSGQLKAANSLFAKTIKGLQRLGYGEEALFEVYALMSKLNLLDRDFTANASHYPGLAQPVKELFSSSSRRVGLEQARINIYPYANEFQIDESWRLKYPREIEALTAIRLAAPFGLPIYRLMAMMFPNEPFSFFQTEKRVHQFLHRLKKNYKVQVKIRSGRIFLSESSIKQIAIYLEPESRPQFLLSGESFITDDVQKHYAVSERQARRTLKEWKSSGWISAMSQGSRKLYKAITTATLGTILFLSLPQKAQAVNGTGARGGGQSVLVDGQLRLTDLLSEKESKRSVQPKKRELPCFTEANQTMQIQIEKAPFYQEAKDLPSPLKENILLAFDLLHEKTYLVFFDLDRLKFNRIDYQLQNHQTAWHLGARQDFVFDLQNHRALTLRKNLKKHISHLLEEGKSFGAEREKLTALEKDLGLSLKKGFLGLKLDQKRKTLGLFLGSSLLLSHEAKRLPPTDQKALWLRETLRQLAFLQKTSISDEALTQANRIIFNGEKKSLREVLPKGFFESMVFDQDIEWLFQSLDLSEGLEKGLECRQGLKTQLPLSSSAD